MEKPQSAGGVVIGPNSKILVVKQMGHKPHSFSLPKGHLEEGEAPLDAAHREIAEEGGISDLKFIKSLGSYERPALHDPNEIKTVFMFLFRTNQVQITSKDPDNNTEPFWVEVNEVENLLTHPGDKEFYQNWLDEIQNFLSKLEP